MAKKLPDETPVYLFLGFLESGKTKFIQETMEDSRFESGEKTLLLVFEEGEEEYDESKFAVKNAVVRYIEKPEDMTEAKLAGLQLEHDIERVVVEYNGMWMLKQFFDAMPEGWFINQVMTFIDSQTFLSYNANMRQQTFDKIQYTEMVVFNRFDPERDDKMEFHKLIRAISRRCDIVYEQKNGQTELDGIEDPLPFDLNAPVVEIEDRDYALFYRDIAENTGNYEGKTVRLKGLVACDKRLPAGTFVVGRHVMTCCEADIQYSGLACVSKELSLNLKTKDWVVVEAKVSIENNKVYKGKGPVLKAVSVERCEEPENVVATFY